MRFPFLTSKKIVLILIVLNIFFILLFLTRITDLLQRFGITNKTSKTSLTTTFACPIPQTYCHKGKLIKVKDNYVGIGYQLPAGTPIYAIIDGGTKGGGVVFSEELGGKRFPSIVLEDQTYRVNYIFIGNDYLSRIMATKGQELIKTNSGNIANFDINLLITVYKLIDGKLERLSLTTEEL
jgi:hypothetical protein